MMRRIGLKRDTYNKKTAAKLVETPGVRTVMIVVLFPILVFGIDLMIMLISGDTASATRFAILLIAAFAVALLTGIALKRGVFGK